MPSPMRRHDRRPEGFGAERTALRALSDQGIVRLPGDRVEVVDDCRMLVRVVAAVFDAGLSLLPGRHARAI